MPRTPVKPAAPPAVKAKRPRAPRGVVTPAPTPIHAAPVMPTLSGEQFAQLLAMLSATPTGARNPDHEIMLESLRNAAKASNDMADAFKRTQRISNAVHPDVSPFTYDPRCALCKARQIHPENGKLGHPQAPLKYVTFYCDRQMRDDDSLTVLERELFNSFTASRTTRKGKWRADLTVDGTHTVLRISLPYSGMDARMDVPPMPQVLFELLSGEDVADPANQIAMMTSLQSRIRELEKQLGVSPSA